ncbi:Alpha/Beta hydrolase protein [Aspergillus oleicola]
MAAQLGVAYSGFSKAALASSLAGRMTVREINLIYIQTGTLDRTIGPNVVSQLNAQLSEFTSKGNTTYIMTADASHTFPTDFDSEGNSPCDVAGPPYISNCGYDGAGAVLEWLLGPLTPRNIGRLSGDIIVFGQSGEYGASGMGTKGFLYVPTACRNGSVVCRLHVVFHGCTQSYFFIGEKFVRDTGYNQWAVQLDMTPSYTVPATTVTGGSKGNLVISTLPYLLPGFATKDIRLDVRDGSTVRYFVEFPEKEKRHLYEFNSLGQGCRFWVGEQLTLLLKGGLLLDFEQVDQAKEAVLMQWRGKSRYPPVLGGYYG